MDKLKEVKKSGFRAPDITERAAVTKGKGQNSFTNGSAFSGRQMGLVQMETLVVFYIRVPREIERHQRKERRTQENLASNQS